MTPDPFESEAERIKRAEAYGREGDVWALMARADEIARLIGYAGDTITMLDDALAAFAFAFDIARFQRASAVLRGREVPDATLAYPVVPERRVEAPASGNPLTGGARPPEQSRGAAGPKDPAGGLARGSKVTGLGARR